MSVTATEARKLLTGQLEVTQAREVIKQLHPETLDRWVGWTGGREVSTPPELSSLLTKVLEAVANGGTLVIGTLPAELTTTAAAAQLGVSRPTLMKMVAAGEIPAHKVGSHTRLRATDVLELRRGRLERQRAAADRLLALEHNE